VKNGWWRAGLRYGLFGCVVLLWNIVFVLWNADVNSCNIVVYFVFLFRFSQRKTEWYTPLYERWKVKTEKWKVRGERRENWIFLHELTNGTEYAILSQRWILMEIVLELLTISLPSAEILWILLCLFPTHYAVYSVIDCHRSSYRLERYSCAES
jgi:hypothetical protein